MQARHHSTGMSCVRCDFTKAMCVHEHACAHVCPCTVVRELTGLTSKVNHYWEEGRVASSLLFFLFSQNLAFPERYGR